jgi:hypothetical protein
LLAVGLVGPLRADEPGFGDLIIGFEDALTVNTPANLEVDLGPASGFMNATPGTYAIANLSDDLAAIFGDWQNDAGLEFGVAGSTSPSNSLAYASEGTLWATSAERAGTAAGTWGPPYLGAGAPAYQSAATELVTYYGKNAAAGAFGGAGTSGLADLDAQVSAFGFPLIGIETSSPLTGSFGNPSRFFIPNATPVSLSSGANVGLGSASADLYELRPTTALGSRQDYLGYFTLSDAGLLTYTVVGDMGGSVAIPESVGSTAILGLGALGVAIGLRRRGARATPVGC